MEKKLGSLIKNIPLKVGLFDSGIGGVSILNELLQLPIAEFVYVADTAYLPYGEKTSEFLIERAKKITQYFKDNNITTIVIACHTSAATSYETLKKTFPEITFIDPLPMTTEDALKKTKNDHVAIMATKRSIDTGIHKKLLHNQNLNISVTEQACPLFVQLIEHGGSQQELTNAIVTYTQTIKKSDVDTVILGCTHYPFIKEQIQTELPHLQFISGASVIKDYIKQQQVTATSNQHISFVVSGNTETIKPLLTKYVTKKNGLSVLITQLERPYL